MATAFTALQWLTVALSVTRLADYAAP